MKNKIEKVGLVLEKMLLAYMTDSGISVRPYAQEIVDTFYSMDGMCCPACNKPFADSDIRSHPAEYHQCKKCGAIQHTACMGNIDWLEGRE